MLIDCIIPAHKKDFNTLDCCIKGIKQNILNLNNIFVISNEDPNIDGIIYIHQSKYDEYVSLKKIIEKYDQEKSNFTYRSGWIYQQFLKLLSSKVISELTDSYLVVDADTIFIRPVHFDPQKFYYCKASEYHLPYLTTIKKLLGVEDTIGFSTISHHMLFNKNIMNEMIEVIMKNFNSNSFFDCVLSVIDYNQLSSMSEWDLYSNYAIKNYSDICEQRQLFWKDISYIPCQNDLDKLKEKFDFVSCHFYMREQIIMPTYVHCHMGGIPPYLIDSFQSIYNADPNSRLILITDQNVEIDGVEIVKISEISSTQTRKVLSMSLFSDYENMLWRTSIFRVFLVRDCIKYLNLKNCYHFDSDVLLFQPASKFEHFISDDDGLSVTYHTEDEIVFGFSKFGNIDKIDQICDILYELIFDEDKRKEYFSIMPNEMQLLGGIYKRRPDLIKRLNVFPNENEIVFDPSSYGQYFGGTHNGDLPGWYGNHHVVGKEIGSGKLNPLIINYKPYVEMEGKKYPLVNLHIHSKNTERFTYHINPEVNLHIEEVYPGSEMLPYERHKLYTWILDIVKPTNILDVGCGVGGATYYLSQGLKKCNPSGKVYSCDPGRSPSQEFFNKHSNVDYRSMYSHEMIQYLIDNQIEIDYIFFDGPEDPDVAMNDILFLEKYIKSGCYFTMHDWEVLPRKYDNQTSTKALKIRQYFESSTSVWQPIEILEGINSSDSVGLCLYKFVGK